MQPPCTKTASSHQHTFLYTRSLGKYLVTNKDAKGIPQHHATHLERVLHVLRVGAVVACGLPLLHAVSESVTGGHNLLRSSGDVHLYTRAYPRHETKTYPNKGMNETKTRMCVGQDKK